MGYRGGTDVSWGDVLASLVLLALALAVLWQGWSLTTFAAARDRAAAAEKGK